MHFISPNPAITVHWVEPPTCTEFCYHNVLSQPLKFLIDFEALVHSQTGVQHPNECRYLDHGILLFTTPHWADSPVQSFSAAFFFRTIREITSSDMSWDMTPVRRKHYKRRSKAVNKSTTILDPIKIMLIASLTLFYYAHPDRSSPAIIFMDSIIVSQTLTTTFGYAPQYLQAIQDSINKLQHCINGNPRLLLLEPLLFPRVTIISLEDSIPDPQITPVTYSMSYILSQRPHKTSLEAPLLPLTQDRLLLHQPRKGRRRQSRLPNKQKIFFKRSSSKSKSTKDAFPPTSTTPQGNSRKTRIRGIHGIQLEARKPAPPPRGAPGVDSSTIEERKPLPLIPAPL